MASSTIAQTSSTPRRGEGFILGTIFLLTSALLAYQWMCVRLMEIDEYLSFYTDRQPTMRGVVDVQLHYPISLDPPTYHLLSHLAMNVLGQTAEAVRLPSLFGFLVFEMSTFFFVRRLAGSRAAVIAMAFPLLTISFYYAAVGRPYGLLLGAYALSLACWQGATRQSESGPIRLALLLGLALALILAITSHFFGVLILLPVGGGELARTLRNRRIDWSILAAISAGVASILAILPFQHAVAVYREHYYSTTVSWHIIPQAYAALFYFHHTLPPLGQHIFIVCLTLFTASLAIGLAHRFKTLPLGDTSHEWAALAVLVMLPFFGYLLGRLVTHTADVRYLIGTLFAVTVLVGAALQRALRSSVIFYTLSATLLCGAVTVVEAHIKDSRLGAVSQLTRFQLSAPTAAALAKDPQQTIYVQSLGDFYFDTFYEPDPAVRSRFTLIYAEEPEIRWLGHNTNAITARHMEHFTALPISPYQHMLSERNPLLVTYQDGWEWVDKDIASRALPESNLGPAFGGGLVQLHQPAK